MNDLKVILHRFQPGTLSMTAKKKHNKLFDLRYLLYKLLACGMALHVPQDKYLDFIYWMISDCFIQSENSF